LDKDNDDKVSTSKLRGGMAETLDVEGVTTFVATVDTNDDDLLTRDEFLKRAHEATEADCGDEDGRWWC
jgi:Ca2+-binding EF-hand superfamily protein